MNQTPTHACHEKTDLKVFVVVIPKEGWARVARPILLLVWHRLLENMIYEVKRLKFWKVGVIPKGLFSRDTPQLTLHRVESTLQVDIVATYPSGFDSLYL